MELGGWQKLDGVRGVNGERNADVRRRRVSRQLFGEIHPSSRGEKGQELEGNGGWGPSGDLKEIEKCLNASEGGACSRRSREVSPEE